MTEFEKELEALINKHSMENESNTPDFILAKYLSSCLTVFNLTVASREKWHGRESKPGNIGDNPEPASAADFNKAVDDAQKAFEAILDSNAKRSYADLERLAEWLEETRQRVEKSVLTT
jgi:acyl-CoA reductase-like NAD-dependent aldehyde dehydrogenase